MSFLKAIRAALPENGIFVDEVSQIGFEWARCRPRGRAG